MFDKGPRGYLFRKKKFNDLLYSTRDFVQAPPSDSTIVCVASSSILNSSVSTPFFKLPKRVFLFFLTLMTVEKASIWSLFKFPMKFMLILSDYSTSCHHLWHDSCFYPCYDPKISEQLSLSFQNLLNGFYICKSLLFLLCAIMVLKM